MTGNGIADGSGPETGRQPDSALENDAGSEKGLTDGDFHSKGQLQTSDQDTTADDPELHTSDVHDTTSAESIEDDIVSTEVSDVVAPEVLPETKEMELETTEDGEREQETETDLTEISLQPEDPGPSSHSLSDGNVEISSEVAGGESVVKPSEEAAQREDTAPDSSVPVPETMNDRPPSPPTITPLEEREETSAVSETEHESQPVPLNTPPPIGSPVSRGPLRTTPSPVPSRESSESEAGPSRHLTPSSRHPSPRRTPSPSHSRFTSPIKSPRHVPFYAPKPTIPASTPVIITGEDEEAGDGSSPFESIPLQSTPPPGLVPLPSSPGLHPGNGHSSVTSPNRLSITIPPSRPLSVQLSRGDTPATPEKKEAPRLHAPPAHPHPYPLPSSTSPRPSHEKRPSQSHAGPSGGLGVKGVSTFEKVISHTRPSWLPPKDRVEDETHYHQWEEMMSQARELEKGKRKVEEAKRAERDRRLAINTPKWEEMLDEKTFSADRIKKDPELRQIWFEGAPTYLRGKAWSLAIGNPLALSKGMSSFHSLMPRKLIYRFIQIMRGTVSESYRQRSIPT